MRRKKIKLAILSTLFAFSACVKEVTINTRDEKPILVVEGSITTDSLPYTVKLTYSGPYKAGLDIPDEFLEKQAKVIITDDQGNSTNLSYKGKGIYETTDPNYIGKAGRSYNVTVELKDGRKYISTPEKIKQPVPISAVNIKFALDNNFIFPSSLHVLIDAKDPANEENYYKWNFYSWVMRQTHGIPCGFGCVMYAYCFQKITDKEVRILSDASINGNEIKNQLVGKSYIYTYGKSYVEISQLSLTREAYQFWRRYEDQVLRTGNILDPLPASIKGNVYNASDPGDFALGYFSASAIVHKRAVLIPFNVTQYLLDISAVQFIPDGSQVCFDYFPNALFYPPPPADQYPPPPGWENAERIEVRW
jgi:hypothetical protein